MRVVSKHRNLTRRWLIGCTALPVVAILVALAIFAENNRLPVITVPPRTVPSPNGFDDFEAAAIMCSSLAHRSPYSMPQPDLSAAAFEACAKDSVPVLALVRQGLSKESAIPQATGTGSNAFPKLARLRELARTMSGAAMGFEMMGDYDRATETRLDGMEMAVSFDRGGLLIDGLVSIACESIAMRNFEDILPKLSLAKLSHADERLERIARKRTEFADFLARESDETAVSEVSMLREIKFPGGIKSLYDMVEDDDDSPSAAQAATPAKKPATPEQHMDVWRFTFANKAAIIHENRAYLLALAAEGRQPYRLVSRVKEPKNLLMKYGVAYSGFGREQFESIKQASALLRVEIALYRFQKQAGRFPDRLEDLPISLVPHDTRIDRFSGQPLKYRRTPTGFLLYSIGADQKDNGGAAPSRGGWLIGDIVAGHLFAPRSPKLGRK